MYFCCLRARVIVSFFLFSSLCSQSLHYEILNGFNSKMGELSISKTETNDTITYQLSSQFSFSFIGSWSVTQSAKAIYHHGILQRYQMNSNQNGNAYSSYIRKEKNHYRVDIDTRKVKKSEQISEDIKHGFLSSYFEPPPQQIFSENSGEFIKVLRIKPNTYAFEINGNTWTLTYENGKMTEASFDGFIDMHLKQKRTH